MDKNDDILMDGIDERIEAFLRGEMSAEEESAFKQEIRLNPELRSRAMAMTSLIRGLQTKNCAIEQEICQEIERVRPAKHAFEMTTSDSSRQRWQNAANINDNAVKLKSRVRPVFLWACSVAAVFVIFFSIYRNHRYQMLDAVVSPYYIEYDIDNNTRGDLDSAKTVYLYTIFNKIQKQKNTKEYINELKPIYASLFSPRTGYRYYAYANDIALNLAIAYIKNDQIKKAIPILEKLKLDNPDTPLSIKAQELLKKIYAL